MVLSQKQRRPRVEPGFSDLLEAATTLPESQVVEQVLLSLNKIMQPSPIGNMDPKTSNEQMRLIRGWVEFLARTGLSAAVKNPIRAQTNSPTGSLAAGLNYMRLAVEEMCAMSLGVARNVAVLTKSECDLESTMKSLQQHAILLQEKDKLIPDRDKSISARDELIAVRDELIAAQDKLVA